MFICNYDDCPLMNGFGSIQSLIRIWKNDDDRVALSFPYNLMHITKIKSIFENGVDLRYIQGLLGHKSSKTTENIYCVVNYYAIRTIS